MPNRFLSRVSLTRGLVGAALLASATVLPLAARAGGLALGTDAKTSILHPGSGALVFDVLAPFSGPDAPFGAHAVPAAKTGVYMLNQLGGILGHKFELITTDTRGDPADAVPALNAMVASTPNLEAVLGPTSDEALATIPVLRRDGIPTFNQAGSIQLDHMHSKWVYRILASDNEDATAMFYQGFVLDHYRRAALLFTSNAGAQSMVAPLSYLWTHAGGKIVINEAITPDQPTYRTALLRLIQAKPQIIFTETDDATAGTLWPELYQLEGLRIPIQGDGPTTGQDYYQAVQKGFGTNTAGLAQFRKDFYGVEFSTAYTKATPTFLYWFHKVYPNQQPLLGHVNYYDSITLIALAMLKAHSIDPNVWINDIKWFTQDLNAAPCYSFVECRAMMTHERVQYIGTKGSMHFNASNTVNVSEQRVAFLPNGLLRVVNQIPSSELAPYQTPY
ncbi:MAG: ABC transporter substrate-binding protein [Firmicutes bacterium]|nr:ABC transporter substrate-binding protein [Bacillota bacterium]